MAHSGGPQYYRSPSPSRYPDSAPYDNYPHRSPSPVRGGPRQNYGRGYTRKVDPADYGHKRPNVDYEAARGYGYGPPVDNTGGRKCCTAFLVCLVLALLAGLAIGLYFAITKSTAKATANSPQKLVGSKGYSGYYVNGVYVVPVTTKPRDIYLIYGTDTPCHKFNNVTATNDPYPNCNKATTRIVLANWTTLKPVYLIPIGAGVSPTAPAGPLATFVGLAIAAALTCLAISVGGQ